VQGPAILNGAPTLAPSQADPALYLHSGNRSGSRTYATPLQAAAHRYSVATENLGDRAGLLAAAALTIDYILTAGRGHFCWRHSADSAVSSLQPHTLINGDVSAWPYFLSVSQI
jgi:hypothetical protein